MAKTNTATRIENLKVGDRIVLPMEGVRTVTEINVLPRLGACAYTVGYKVGRKTRLIAGYGSQSIMVRS